ncbi:MAG: TIGR02147 family protein [Pseudobdellovibrionaceae bacterium]
MIKDGPSARPEILNYRDYRKFLEDSYYYKKSQRSGFSFRRFSQLCGISSPNYLQLVMQNKRNLSVALADTVADVLHLSAPEKEYFCALVELDLLPAIEKEKVQKRLLSSIKCLVAKQMPKEQFRILHEWYHLVIRELVLLPDFQNNGEWISEKLRRLISPQHADESLSLLLRTGFLKHIDSKYIQTDPVIETTDGFHELAVLKMHSETLKNWLLFINDTHRDQRELGILTIPIANSKIPEFKRRIQNFQDEIIGWLQDETNPDQVVQLGTYLIPISKTGK